MKSRPSSKATLAIVLLAAAAAAGCAQAPSAPPLPDVAGPALPPWLLADGSAPRAAWGNLTLHANGTAGEWLVLYQPFLEPIEAMEEYVSSYTVSASVEAPADAPARMFLLGPVYLLNTSAGLVPSGTTPFEQQGLRQGGDTVSYASSRSVRSVYGDDRDGILLAFSGNGPWSLSFQYSQPGSGEAQPWWLARGANATLHVGGDRLVPVQGPVDQLRLTGEVPAGWTHLQVLSHRLQPDQVRSYDYRLPGGEQRSGASLMYGYQVPLLGGSASSSGALDSFGAMQEVAGPFSMDLTYVHADLGADLGFAHLPLPGAPPGVDVGVYGGRDWPFPQASPGGAP